MVKDEYKSRFPSERLGNLSEIINSVLLLFEQEQEEIARRVAEKILQDVTSVTQAISAIKNPNLSTTDADS